MVLLKWLVIGAVLGIVVLYGTVLCTLMVQTRCGKRQKTKKKEGVKNEEERNY